MKSLQFKKLSALFITWVFCITILRAQIMHHSMSFAGDFRGQSSKGSSSYHANSLTGVSTSNAPAILWQKCIGGSGDDYVYHIVKLADGNYLCCGASNSTNGDFNASKKNYDAYLLKTDKAGNILWRKTYGGSNDDEFSDMVETRDGDLIVIGNTSSTDGEVSGNHGNVDVWVVRINKNGNLLEQYCYGGSGVDQAYNIIKNKDGNIVFAGHTSSADGDISNNNGDYDAWVVKLKKSWAIDFSITFGGSGYEELRGGVIESNGDLIVSGTYSVLTSDYKGIESTYKGMAAKLNQLGKIVYLKHYGGSGSDDVNAAILAPDGNIVLAGHAASQDSDLVGNFGFNPWILKISESTGNIIWSKPVQIYPYKGAVFGVMTTSDGGFVVCGVVTDKDLSQNRFFDAYAAGLDGNGNTLWSKQFGGNKFESTFDVKEEDDGSVLLAGVTNSNNNDVSGNHGGIEDVWLVNLAPNKPHTSSSIENTSVINIGPERKEDKILLSNFPNPLSKFTTIHFAIPQTCKVSLKVFDMAGRAIKTLANEDMLAGSHEIKWNANDEKGNAVPSGIYLLKMDAWNYSKTKMLSVIKNK